MFNRKTVAAILAIGVFAASVSFGRTLRGDWNDYLHYTKIGRFDLAKGYAKAILESKPHPLKLLSLSEENPQGYAILLRVIDNASDPELVELSQKVLAIIEQGKFIRRTDPKIIAEEIRRLSSTERGRLTAVRRLHNAGEYAIVYMLDAMEDKSRKDELSNIIWALPQIGRDAIRPLAAALQMEDIGIKADIIQALGKIKYPQSLPYLKYIIEKDDSAELRKLASRSIKKINPAALKVPAAQLFYQLGEDYYYNAPSLAPAEDANFANMWFWDSQGRRLIREKVDRIYFNDLMAMRCCEWALKSDAGFGKAIGLWLAAFCMSESSGINMPSYFGAGHADVMTYATTAGAEYQQQALARATKDKNAHLALCMVEALATTAGEKSLFLRIGPVQPLMKALSFDDEAVRFSAAIAIAAIGPEEKFPESKLVVKNLSQALSQVPEQGGEKESWSEEQANSYALRAAEAMLKLVLTRNQVIDLSAAQETLIDATKGKRAEIQVLASRILAGLSSPGAQRAIAAMALDENNTKDIRLAAFGSLDSSAKINGNLLDEGKIDAIYSLVSSNESDPDLRSAAAAAYGALNLPSEKVKDLILDQAKS